MRTLQEAGLTEIANIYVLHDAVDHIHNDVSNNNSVNHTHEQRLHNAKSSVLLLNFNIGDYVMIRPHKKQKH